MNHEMKPITIDFPLMGEWMAPNTPQTKVPSHGTDLFGETYAIDLLQVDWGRPGTPFYDVSVPHYLLFGVPLSRCYAWGQPIYVPFDGQVLIAADGITERKRVHWLTDLIVALRNARSVRLGSADPKNFAGNYVIMQYAEDVYAAFVHMQNGSVCVKPGQFVKKGEQLGRIGHSGNSMAPHLHFQLMDNSDAAYAKGLPFVFHEYEVLHESEWVKVTRSLPSEKDRIRAL
ncbi:MAG: M23 family metallopeptidase [Anaerofustis sp.]